MSEVADGDFLLLIHIGEEGSFVIDPEGEYAVLIGKGKGSAIYSAVVGCSAGFKGETVEGREHCEF